MNIGKVFWKYAKFLGLLFLGIFKPKDFEWSKEKKEKKAKVEDQSYKP